MLALPKKQAWLACFSHVIPSLQNNDHVSCSFGDTNDTGTGFWKPNAMLHVIIKYRGWFGWWRYRDRQDIRIVDSTSFTGFSWGRRMGMFSLGRRMDISGDRSRPEIRPDQAAS